jgi:hypothetical protein
MEATPSSKPKRWFFMATFPCALLAVSASLWWSYGGESTLALVLTLVAWAATGVLGFLSGLRGEHRQWKVSPLVNGLLTGLITLGATFGAAAVANFRTTPGREGLATPMSTPKQWVALVGAAARESGSGEVLSVLCDTKKPKAGDVASCAVTFEGPRCQYWFVGSVDGKDRAEASGELYKSRGTYDPSFGALC